MKTPFIILAALITLSTAAIAASQNCPTSAKEISNKSRGKATYFTYTSCLREGTSGITASGKRLDDSAMWCALPAWKMKILRLKFGQRILVTNLHTGTSAIVKLMDRGPGRKSQAAGVVIDLTAAAYRRLNGSRRQGHIHIEYRILTANAQDPK
jgi:rare lipoprotein A (peptidoglycan hydrolase)